MRVSITDDFSLQKIADSGQCFRVREFPGGMFRFVYKDKILYISETAAGEYEVSCSSHDWESVWRHYFDLDTKYAEIRKSIPKTDQYLTAAADSANGIRILMQDPFEMLISFIISQRKSIPAIKQSVELLCASCGAVMHTEQEDLYLFPDARQIADLSIEELAACKLGYRIPYVQDAAQKIHSGEINLPSLSSLSDAELISALESINGVGVKVANCVSLFGYHRTACAPVDVWIKRVIDQQYNGMNPFPQYGNNAGIMQQFMFYNAQTSKNGQKLLR